MKSEFICSVCSEEYPCIFGFEMDTEGIPCLCPFGNNKAEWNELKRINNTNK